MRVVLNPDDGTSQFRARVVHGEGPDTKVVAMFVDAQAAQEYVEWRIIDRTNPFKLSAVEAVLGSPSKRGCPCACHGDRTVYHIVPCHTPLLGQFDKRLPRT